MGELRSLLAVCPSTSGQRRALVKTLAQLLERFSPEVLAQAIVPYVQRALDAPGWDAVGFAPPPSWRRDLMRGQQSPALALVTAMELTSRDERPVALARALALPRLRILRVHGWRLDATCSMLLMDSASQPPLRMLLLEDCTCDESWAVAMAQWPSLAQVHTLHVPTSALSTQAALSLASREELALRELRARGVMSAPALEALMGSPWIEQLRVLELDHLGSGARSMRPRAHGRAHTRAHARSVDRAGQGDALALALTRAASGPTSLDALNLASSGLTPLGLAALLESPRLNRLTRLVLDGNPALGDEAMALFARSEQLDNLRQLSLRDCAITEDGAQALGESEHGMTRLEHLDLSFNPIFGERRQRSWGEYEEVWQALLSGDEVRARHFWAWPGLQVTCLHHPTL